MSRKAIYDSAALQYGKDENYSITNDAYDNTPTKVTPSAGIMTQGMRPRHQVGAQHLNWILNQYALVMTGLIDHTAQLEAADGTNATNIASVVSKITALQNQQNAFAAQIASINATLATFPQQLAAINAPVDRDITFSMETLIQNSDPYKDTWCFTNGAYAQSQVVNKEFWCSVPRLKGTLNSVETFYSIGTSHLPQFKLCVKLYLLGSWRAGFGNPISGNGGFSGAASGVNPLFPAANTDAAYWANGLTQSLIYPVGTDAKHVATPTETFLVQVSSEAGTNALPTDNYVYGFIAHYSGVAPLSTF